MAKTECVVCTKEIDVPNKFNGEPMCDKCYREKENHVFGDDDNG